MITTDRQEETSHLALRSMISSTNVERLRKRTPQRHMHVWGYAGFILVSLLYASFYPIAKPSLSHIDTAVFVGFQMLCLAPPALFLLVSARRWIDLTTLGHGILLGTCLGIGFLLVTLAMDYTSITETAMFSCANGVIVVLISWLIFRKRIRPMTWIASLCSIVGILVLLSVSHLQWQGDLFAFTGGLFCTAYNFLVDDLWQHPGRFRAVLGVQLLTMACEMMVYALIFGNWGNIHFVLPSDIVIFCYISLATTLLPIIITMTMRRYVNGITVTFLAVLEPIAGAVFAFVFAHERLSSSIYIGGGLAIGSVLLEALANVVNVKRLSPVYFHKLWVNVFRMHKQQVPQKAPRLIIQGVSSLGEDARLLLACLWSTPNGLNMHTLQQLTGVSPGRTYQLLSHLQKRGYVMLRCHRQKSCRYTLHPSYWFSLTEQLYPLERHIFSEKKAA